MRGSRTSIAVLLAAAVLAGCGSSGDDHEPGLTSGQAAGLVAQLEAVRVAAAARDVAGTRAALARFRHSVAQLRRSGALSASTARSLRIGAARVLRRVASDNPPPAQPAPATTQTTPAPAPPPPPAKAKHRKKHEKPGKKGKGHGEGEGE